MNKEKQIEEMAKIFCGMKNGCNGCMWNKTYCNERNYAEEIYNAGYRKQSEGEWRSELVKRCDWKGKKHDHYQPNSCSLCHEAVLKRTPFCPNCGAKMKGGAE